MARLDETLRQQGTVNVSQKMSGRAGGNKSSLPDLNLALLSGNVCPVVTVQVSHICWVCFSVLSMPPGAIVHKPLLLLPGG